MTLIDQDGAFYTSEWNVFLYTTQLAKLPCIYIMHHPCFEL